jgi:hypothetical protein
MTESIIIVIAKMTRVLIEEILLLIELLVLAGFDRVKKWNAQR